MITVKSTQFQNNIGHYISLLEAGETVKLKRVKPNPTVLILSAEKVEEEHKSKKQMILNKIEENKNYKPKYFNNGLDLQKSVRD